MGLALSFKGEPHTIQMHVSQLRWVTELGVSTNHFNDHHLLATVSIFGFYFIFIFIDRMSASCNHQHLISKFNFGLGWSTWSQPYLYISTLLEPELPCNIEPYLCKARRSTNYFKLWPIHTIILIVMPPRHLILPTNQRLPPKPAIRMHLQELAQEILG